MKSLTGFLLGLLFGVGLVISGMSDPAKVLNFLDLFGTWDPSLAFVMGGAIVPMAIAWLLTRGRKPLIGGSFPAPPEPKTPARSTAAAVAVRTGRRACRS